MEKSKFLDPSIGLDEIVTLHYGLLWFIIGGIPCKSEPKTTQLFVNVLKDTLGDINT